jgi:hypothetical protein
MNSPTVAKPLDTIRVLSEDIGARGSSSDNERRAAEWVAEQWRALGLNVTIEPFRAVPTFSWAYGFLFAVFVYAAVMYPTSAVFAFALCLLALVVFALESSSIEILTRILPHGASQNVVGVLPATPYPFVRGLPARGEAKQKLILTAHVDSSRSALIWHPRIVPYFRHIFLTLVAAMLAEFLLYLLGAITNAAWVWYVSLVPAIILALAVLIFIDRETRYTYTPGANDNASGVAVMLALVEQLAREPLNQTEVWAVATGCEESGPFGILRFLQAHTFDRATTFFLNFDNIGAGRVSYVTGEGLLLTLKADARLVEIARGVAEADESLSAQACVYKTLPTDNTVTLTKGYRGLSLMAFDARGVLPHWHWKTDTVENVDAETLERGVRFAMQIVRGLDEQN